jgi:hypothetical protein
LATAILLALVPATAFARASNACREAAARARTTLPDYSSFQPYSSIGQARCFDFTGDGRRDLVVTRWEAMNHGAHYWAAFRHRRDGSYTQIIGLHDCCSSRPRFGLTIGIRHVGPVLFVSQAVYRSTDAYCCPSGGSKTGRWEYRAHRLRLVSIERSR